MSNYMILCALQLTVGSETRFMLNGNIQNQQRTRSIGRNISISTLDSTNWSSYETTNKVAIATRSLQSCLQDCAISWFQHDSCVGTWGGTPGYQKSDLRLTRLGNRNLWEAHVPFKRKDFKQRSFPFFAFILLIFFLRRTILPESFQFLFLFKQEAFPSIFIYMPKSWDRTPIAWLSLAWIDACQRGQARRSLACF